MCVHKRHQQGDIDKRRNGNRDSSNQLCARSRTRSFPIPGIVNIYIPTITSKRISHLRTRVCGTGNQGQWNWLSRSDQQHQHDDQSEDHSDQLANAFLHHGLVCLFVSF